MIGKIFKLIGKKDDTHLRSMAGDTIRIEQKNVKLGGEWRVYKHDGERFQLVDEVLTEEEAVTLAKKMVH